MLKVQLLPESCSKPLKRFKQEIDAIRLCFRKKLNALENFLERGVGMEARRLVSRSRVTYKSLMFRDQDSNCISSTHSFTRLISLHLSFLLPLLPLLSATHLEHRHQIWNIHPVSHLLCHLPFSAQLAPQNSLILPLNLQWLLQLTNGSSLFELLSWVWML